MKYGKGTAELYFEKKAEGIRRSLVARRGRVKRGKVLDTQRRLEVLEDTTMNLVKIMDVVSMNRERTGKGVVEEYKSTREERERKEREMEERNNFKREMDKLQDEADEIVEIAEKETDKKKIEKLVTKRMELGNEMVKKYQGRAWKVLEEIERMD